MNKSPYSLRQIQREMSKEALIAKAIVDLMQIHKELIQKIDHYEKNVKGLKPPKGEKPSKSEIIEIVTPIIKSYINEYNVEKFLGERLKDIKDGEPGHTPTKEELEALIKPIVTEQTANFSDILTKKDIKKLVTLIANEIKLPEYKVVDEEQLIGSIKAKKTLKTGDIDGLEQTISAFRNQLSRGYLHGGGVPSLSAGTNVTLTPKADGGFTISATGGGGGGTVITPTSGAINDINTAFVFTSKPNIVCVNGAFYRETKGWTWNSGTSTVTLSNPVGTGGDIYALV